METIAKWFVVPLALTVVWFIVIFVNDSGLLDKLSPAARSTLKIAGVAGAVLLLATIWVFRRQGVW